MPAVGWKCQVDAKRSIRGGEEKEKKSRVSLRCHHLIELDKQTISGICCVRVLRTLFARSWHARSTRRLQPLQLRVVCCVNKPSATILETYRCVSSFIHSLLSLYSLFSTLHFLLHALDDVLAAILEHFNSTLTASPMRIERFDVQQQITSPPSSYHNNKAFMTLRNNGDKGQAQWLPWGACGWDLLRHDR